VYYEYSDKYLVLVKMQPGHYEKLAEFNDYGLARDYVKHMNEKYEKWKDQT
jgi:hypothetical protein